MSGKLQLQQSYKCILHVIDGNLHSLAQIKQYSSATPPKKWNARVVKREKFQKENQIGI